MAAIITNTFLALVLLFSLNSYALSDYAKIKRSFIKKNYSQVLQNFSRTRSKKDLYKKSQILLILAISSERIKRYDYAYSFYYKKLVKEHRRTFIYVNKSIQNGDLIDETKVTSSFKVSLWKVATNLYKWLMEQDKVNKRFLSRQNLLSKIVNTLIELEFREAKGDKILSNVNIHAELLNRKESRYSYRLFVDIISWQKEATITKNDMSLGGDLVVTNTGLCAGGGVSYQNYYFGFNLDTCLALGLGNVSLNSGSIEEYQQSNIVAAGVKVSPGISVFVSEKKAELGIRVPIFYAIQDLEEPSGFTLEEDPNLSFLVSLYSKWPINEYFIQTEFSKFLSNDSSMWSIGVGLNF